jgi:hypothetical protein
VSPPVQRSNDAISDPPPRPLSAPPRGCLEAWDAPRLAGRPRERRDPRFDPEDYVYEYRLFVTVCAAAGVLRLSRAFTFSSSANVNCDLWSAIRDRRRRRRSALSRCQSRSDSSEIHDASSSPAFGRAGRTQAESAESPHGSPRNAAPQHTSEPPADSGPGGHAHRIRTDLSCGAQTPLRTARHDARLGRTGSR